MRLNDFKKPLENPQEARAKERNTYLSAWKKIFNRTTADDIYEEEKDDDSVLEEAMAINQAADRLIQEGKAHSYTEAVEKLVQTEFPTKNSLEIMAEEKARAGALRFAELIEANDFTKAEKVTYAHKESPLEKKHEEARHREIGDPEFSYGTDIASENAKSWRNDINIPSWDLFDKYKDEIIRQKFAELKNSKDERLLQEFQENFNSHLKRMSLI